MCIQLLLSDENLNDKAPANHFLSELQKAKIVDFISANDLGEACFEQEKTETIKFAAWEKVWEYATTECKIQENKKSCQNVAKLKEVFRKWRYALNDHRKLTNKSGEGAVKRLSDVDQRYQILLDGIKGIAHGFKVYTIAVIS